MNIVGTHWLWVTRYCSTNRSASPASKRSMTTAVPPSAWVVVVKASGAEWYSGAGDRYTVSPSKPKSIVRRRDMPSGSSTVTSSSGRLMPLGRPVVPELYSIAAPARLVLEPLGREGGDGVLVRRVPVDGAVPHQQHVAARGVRGDVPGHVGEGVAGHERPGPAVVHDVAGLVGGEVAVDGGDVEARPEGRPEHLEVAGVVVGEDGDVVAGVETGGAPQPGQLVRPGVELGEGHHLAGAGHDHGGLVGARGGVGTGVGHVVSKGVGGEGDCRPGPRRRHPVTGSLRTLSRTSWATVATWTPAVQYRLPKVMPRPPLRV